jgi:tetratricopeptide (TPR) repeat protein
MSISSSNQPNRTALRVARELSAHESDSRPRAVPDLRQESPDDREWDERVAREVRHQEVIEASFDRAEAYARVGDFEQALEWLDRAATLSDGLPPAYRARRARWALSTAVRLRPTGGDQAAPGSGGLQGA